MRFLHLTWLIVFQSGCAPLFDAVNAAVPPLTGDTYHVDQRRGDDRFAGTPTEPLQTISACVKSLAPGGTCIVHAGIYRETVRIVGGGRRDAPMRIVAAQPGEARVTGLDRLDRWVEESNGSYVAQSSATVYDVFANGVPLRLARFPNATEYFKPQYLSFSQAACKTAKGVWTEAHEDCLIYDEDGPCGSGNNCWNRSFPKNKWRLRAAQLGDVDWQGAMISIVDQSAFTAERSIVARSLGNGTIEIERYAYKPVRAGDAFYISGHPEALDTNQEWVEIPSAGQVWLKAKDQPIGIEIKTRELAFDLREASFVHVDGFEIFAGSVQTGSSSTGIVLDNLKVSYPVHHGMFGATSNYPGQGANRYRIDEQTLGKGVTLGGRDNILSNSVIAHSWCDGATVYGSGNTVQNNVISDVNWSMTACAAIATNGASHKIIGNTMHDCGRACLWHQKTYDAEIAYNDIYSACWLGKDCGVVGSYGWFGADEPGTSDLDGDGLGTRYHHNWIHGNRAQDGGGGCLYLDQNERDYLLHHNVLWNCHIAFILNDGFRIHGGSGHRVYNNTCFDVNARASNYGPSGEWQLTGVHFANNLCTTSDDRVYAGKQPEVRANNNLGPGAPNVYGPGNSKPWPSARLGLEDVFAKQFHPVAGAIAIDHGVHLPGVTGMVVGEPDVGAYERGVKAKRVGSSLMRAQAP